MKNSLRKTIVVLLVALALLPLSVASVRSAGIGFQGRLIDPPRVVSGYDEEPDVFSAAMYPMSHPVLSRVLLRKPTNDSSRFDPRILKFRTRIRNDVELVPAAVDAGEFLNYRSRKFREQRSSELVFQAIRKSQRENRRQGLSIGVNLPKRFDQIFGEGGGNLRVSGYRRLTFSGRSQWNDGAQTDAGRQSRFPSLNMEQISRFDITGTIGTKISVRVSQDSQTDIPLANRIQIRYKGDDDDILKVIEAGNTNLSLPNTRFVGYSSRIQGLFGIKAEAQLGNLRLIGIASQEKGSSERASISASGDESARVLRDYEYVEGRIYDLGYPGSTPYNTFSRNDSIRVLYVYQQDIQDSLASLPAIMYVDPSDKSTRHDSMSVKLVDASQYTLIQDAIRNLHIVHFNSPRRDAVGVYMIIDRYPDSGPPTTDTVGSIPSDSAYSLQYLQSTRSDYKPGHPTWDLMWRNCYRIPRGVSTDQIGINVFKALPGRQNTSSALDYQVVNGQSQGSYMRILGLDQRNRQGNRIPDDIIDDLPLIFEPEWGLLIFPHRRPFDSDTTYVTQGTSPPLAIKVPNIYNYLSPTQKTERSEYYIQITSKSRSSQIRLNRANVIEGSERITLNGRVLQKDVDYKITYDFGQVTLLTDEATDPNADLNIEFEYAPFLAVQKKTLLGLRAEYEWSRDLKFGATVLYKSDKAQDRKPRVGQETAKAMVLDFDAAFKIYPSFLTKAVNALPLVTTEAKSVISVNGEIARSLPNPNVEGVAYIDDFESSQDLLTLGITRTIWTNGSKPAIDELNGPAYQRGKLVWHQQPQIAWETVYDNEVAAGEGSIRPLRLIFYPANKKLSWDSLNNRYDTLGTTRSWGSIMRYFGSRVDAKRAQLFEMRAKATSGILHLDFGIISEDVDGNGSPNTEDLDRNNAVSEEEDIGLDVLPDSLEVGRNGRPYSLSENPDPEEDNWWFQGDWPPPVPASRANNQSFRDSVEDQSNLLYYQWVNGTENNREDQLVLGRPDEEVLSQSGFELDNAYFSYQINFSDTAHLVPGSEKNGWKTYRLPIRDSLALDTMVSNTTDSAKWELITHVRAWIETDTGRTEPVIIEIANWSFLQSNWQDTLFEDSQNVTNGLEPSTFFVASVSEQDGTFSPPPGVEAYRNRQTDIAEAQRGLSLVYDALNPNDTGMVTRDLITSESYSGYRRVEMFVNGQPGVEDDSLLFFFRLGRDNSNYYEYRSRLTTGWSDNNRLDMDFNVATALKDSVLRALKKPTDSVDATSGNYRVVGRPNINEVRFFGIGLINESNKPVTGRVWLDELRLTDVRDDQGTAVRMQVSGSFADLLTYSFNIERKDAFFRGLSTATRGGSSNNLGSGSTSDNFSVNTTLQFHKFLPRSWNARLPISTSYSKSTQTPLLRNNSDIVLPPEIRKQERSINETRRFSVSESFNKKGKNPLFSVLLNRQKVSFSYTRTERSSVNNPFSFAENYNVRPEYDMSIKSIPSIPIFFWTKWIPIAKKASESRLQLFPKTWRWSATFNRSLSITEDKDLNRRSSFRRDLDGRMNMSYSMFDNLTMSLNYTTKRDLTDPDLINLSLKDPKIGLETNFSQTYRTSYDPKLLKFLTTQWSYSANYRDDWDRSTETRNSNLQRNWSVTGQFRHLTLLGGSQSGSRGFSGRGRSSSSSSKTETKEKTGKPFYDVPLSVLRFATGWINPFTYKYSESFRNSVPALQVRPSLSYRFGLKDQPEVRRLSNNRSPAASEQISYDLGSGFKILGGFSTNVKFSESINRDLVKIGGNKFERKSTGWPDLRINITEFKNLPIGKKYINGFIRVFSPRTGYSRQVKRDMNLDGKFLTSKSESINQSPLLSLNFRLLRSLSMSGSYSTSKTASESYNSNDGKLESETKSLKKTWAITAKWSFSAPGGLSIPIFGKVKFQSQVTFDVNVKFTSNFAETATTQSGGKFAVGTDKSDFSVQPVISYTFSRQIKGGVRGRWQDTNDIKNNRQSHTRELQIWAEMRF